MSIKKLFYILLFFPIMCFTQDINRKGKLFLDIGPEYRITPTYKLSDYSEKAIFTNVDLQNSGMGLNLGVNYYLTSSLGIGFNNSFRHDLITTQDTQGSSETNKGFLIGYHFNLFYHFKVFNKGDFLVSAGFSMLNRNSEFNLSRPLYDNNGQQVGTSSTIDNYKYSANKLSIGYANGKSKLYLGIYITRNSGYFRETTTFMIPFLNYSYSLAKL